MYGFCLLNVYNMRIFIVILVGLMSKGHPFSVAPNVFLCFQCEVVEEDRRAEATTTPTY
jgi:hypothetical protein